MIKSLLRPIYIPLLSSYRRFKYFVLPNIFTKTNYTFKTKPNIQQRVLLTGKGEIKVGENCMFGFKSGGFHFGGSIELQVRSANSEIIIGDNVSTNNNVFICSSGRICIGSKTLIGQNVIIMDFEAHGNDPNDRNKTGVVGMVEIGENVWIGNNVSILKNSVVGKNSIVATGAVVSGVFPENVVIGGVPAKIIKNL